jgi:Uncharacterized protein conserved in bacteria
MVFFKKHFYLVISLLIFSSFTGISTAQSIEGVWFTEKDEAKVHIYKNSDGLYEGKLIWTEEKSERTEKALGIIVLKDAKKINDKKYEGIAFLPQTNKEYNCIVTIKNKNELDLRGYVGIPVFGKTTRWTRTEE